MGFEDDLDSEIVINVTNAYKKAEDWLMFKNTEIENIFSDEEIKQIEAFMKELQQATNDNDKKAMFYKYIGIISKLLKISQ
jgi:hypothetical protein